MNSVINLRQFKKRSARQDKEQQAEQNRILFGRSKVEKAFDKRQKQKDQNFLHHHCLEKADDGDHEQ